MVCQLVRGQLPQHKCCFTPFWGEEKGPRMTVIGNDPMDPLVP